MGETPNATVAVPLSRSRHTPETNKTRYPWSRVRVFGGLKYPYPYPYPRLNPHLTRGYTHTRAEHYVAGCKKSATEVHEEGREALFDLFGDGHIG
jgi:hypothetical protein